MFRNSKTRTHVSTWLSFPERSWDPVLIFKTCLASSTYVASYHVSLCIPCQRDKDLICDAVETPFRYTSRISKTAAIFASRCLQTQRAGRYCTFIRNFLRISFRDLFDPSPCIVMLYDGPILGIAWWTTFALVHRCAEWIEPVGTIICWCVFSICSRILR